ncbi:hypothetical protein AVEN_210004-1 [Araneus ventricosus]|uniref:Uncharacterized protein n=1 Tax=Araneus ventricosus TaxID=182803 RepID=A0A4Y2U7Z2_ARAVE|nr:hypothetical protein AVEN_15805-1 [Araneus ventricosus]GBO09137.1 hypothetical protein AVEN_210004-1 [Araneus ventricosus]
MRIPRNPKTISAEFRMALTMAKAPPVMANMAASDRLETVTIHELKSGRLALKLSSPSIKRDNTISVISMLFSRYFFHNTRFCLHLFAASDESRIPVCKTL